MFSERFGVDTQEGEPALESKNGVRPVNVSQLKPYPRNAEIYGEEDVSDLIIQIRAYGGIADPLKIKEDYTIISGHRRWQAARNLDITEAPARLSAMIPRKRNWLHW